MGRLGRGLIVKEALRHLFYSQWTSRPMSPLNSNFAIPLNNHKAVVLRHRVRY